MKHNQKQERLCVCARARYVCKNVWHTEAGPALIACMKQVVNKIACMKHNQKQETSGHKTHLAGNWQSLAKKPLAQLAS